MISRRDRGPPGVVLRRAVRRLAEEHEPGVADAVEQRVEVGLGRSGGPARGSRRGRGRRNGLVARRRQRRGGPRTTPARGRPPQRPGLLEQVGRPGRSPAAPASRAGRMPSRSCRSPACRPRRRRGGWGRDAPRVAGEVGPAASRDDRGDLGRRPRRRGRPPRRCWRRNSRRPCPPSGPALGPNRCGDDPPREQADVEPQVAGQWVRRAPPPR